MMYRGSCGGWYPPSTAAAPGGGTPLPPPTAIMAAAAAAGGGTPRPSRPAAPAELGVMQKPYVSGSHIFLIII